MLPGTDHNCQDKALVPGSRYQPYGLKQHSNAVSTHTVDIDYQELRLYPGNYDQFLEAKALNESQKQKEIESLERKTAEMQAFVERFRYKATKARQAHEPVELL